MITKTFLMMALSLGHAFAQVDPYQTDPAPPPVNLLTRYEAFSMDLKRAADLQRGNSPDATLYEQVVAAVGKGEAAQESLMVVRSRAGFKAMTQSAREIIYPTEFQPVFKKDSVASNPPVSTVTALLATAFETRQTGEKIEVETMAGTAGVHLRSIPEHVTLLGIAKYGQGASEAEMPIFSRQQLNSAAMLKEGVPFLLGTTTPRIVAGDVTVPDDSFWFSFATVFITKK